MIDITSGYITNINFDKSFELVIAYVVFLASLALSMTGISSSINKLNISFNFNDEFKYLKNLKEKLVSIIEIEDIYLFISLFFIASILYLNLSNNHLINYQKVFLGSVGIFSIFIFNKKKLFVKLNLFQCSIFFLLALYKLLFIQSFFLIIFFLITFLYLIFKNHKLFLFSCILFILLPFGESDYVVGDLFHSSEVLIENFVSSEQFINGKIFHNIGRFESLIPFYLAKIVSLFSFNNILISYASSVNIISFLLLIYIVSNFDKKTFIVSLPLIMFFPLFRVSFLFSLAISIFALLTSESQRSKNYFYFLFSLLPILFLNIQTIYFVLILLTFIFIWLKLDHSFLNYFAVCFLLFFFILLNFQEIILLITTMININGSYIEANGFPFPYENGYLSNFKFNPVFFLKYFLLFFATYIFFYSFNLEKKRNYLFFIAFSLPLFYLIINYAFVRIDLNSPSRLLPIFFYIMFISIFLIKQNLRANMFLISFFCVGLFFNSYYHNKLSFNHINSLSFNKSFKNDYFSFDDETKSLISRVSLKSKGYKTVLNLSDDPMLTSAIPNMVSPYFTSLWVSHSKFAQEKIIDSIIQNGYELIYLGHISSIEKIMWDYYNVEQSIFKTHDFVDNRVRCPYLFKFLNENYFFIEEGDIGYAVKKQSHKNDNSILFSDFFIGSTAKYYQNKFKNKYESYSVFIDCPLSFNLENKTILIINRDNKFYADLNCGSNDIPSVYFEGEFKKYEIVSKKNISNLVIKR